MIRSYDFESVGGIYVGKGPLGKYQEEVIHTPLQERCAAGASWRIERWDLLVCQKRWWFCSYFIVTWQRAAWNLSLKDKSKRFGHYAPKGSCPGLLLRHKWLFSSPCLLGTLSADLTSSVPTLVLHLVLDRQKPSLPSIIHPFVGHLIRCCHESDCQRVLEEKRKSPVPLLPRLCSCHPEYFQKLSQHLPYFILISLVHLMHIFMIGWT